MQEAFVATLLEIAHHSTDIAIGLSPSSGVDEHDDADTNDDELNKYQLWRVMKRTVALLKKDMESSQPSLPSGKVPDAELLSARFSAAGGEASSVMGNLPFHGAHGNSSSPATLPHLASLSLRDRMQMLPGAGTPVTRRQQPSAPARWQTQMGGEDELSRGSVAAMYPSRKVGGINPQAIQYSSP